MIVTQALERAARTLKKERRKADAAACLRRALNVHPKHLNSLLSAGVCDEKDEACERVICCRQASLLAY